MITGKRLGVPAMIAALLATSPAHAAAIALSENLSVGAMFWQADWLVKIVMIGLGLASLATWTIFVAKLMELRKANAAEKQVHDQLVSLRSLRDAALDGNLAFTPLVREALAELRLSFALFCFFEKEQREVSSP